VTYPDPCQAALDYIERINRLTDRPKRSPPKGGVFSLLEVRNVVHRKERDIAPFNVENRVTAVPKNVGSKFEFLSVQQKCTRVCWGICSYGSINDLDTDPGTFAGYYGFESLSLISTNKRIQQAQHTPGGFFAKAVRSSIHPMSGNRV